MDVVRVERWGERYRFIKFKGRQLASDGRVLRPKPHKRPADEGEFWIEKWNEEDERLSNSVSRSRNRVLELGFCNQWDYFATFTLSSDKADRFNLQEFVKRFGQWVGNYNKRYNCKLRYLIIPEQHKDGAWHMHGLLSGVASASLITNEHGYLDMPYYRNNFGFISLDPVRNHKRCVTYVSKYITKDVAATAHALGRWAHMFYASRGLKGKELLWQGYGDFDGGTDNAFCTVKFTDDWEEAYTVMGRGILALKDPRDTMDCFVKMERDLEVIYYGTEKENGGNGNVGRGIRGVTRRSGLRMEKRKPQDRECENFGQGNTIFEHDTRSGVEFLANTRCRALSGRGRNVHSRDQREVIETALKFSYYFANRKARDSWVMRKLTI